MKKFLLMILITLFSLSHYGYGWECTTSIECGNSETMGCTGDESCSASETDKTVTCDGVTTSCPLVLPEKKVIAP